MELKIFPFHIKKRIDDSAEGHNLMKRKINIETSAKLCTV